MSEIAFIGAGNIGAPMARTLLRGQLKVKVCDSSERVRREFEELGCETAAKASDVATSWAVIIMVNTGEQLIDTIFGPHGLVAGLRDETRPLIIVMSTVLPSIIEDTAKKLADFGIRMIDAPVSGGPIPAAEGRLTIMVGGDPANIEAAFPVLKLLGNRVVICGAIASGQKTKIINNLVGVTNQLVMGEALELASSCGLDPACLLSVMDSSSGRNFWSRDWDMTRRQYAEYAQVAEENLYVERSIKDLDLARHFADATHIDTPLLDVVANATSKLQNSEIAKRFRTFSQS